MFNFFTRRERKDASGSLIALALTGRAHWGGRDYASLAREGVMQNAIVYRCVRMLAEGAASVPLLLYEGATELESHPLLDLMAVPNPHVSGRELLETFYAQLQCAGNAYLQAAMLDGMPRALFVLRPDRMTAIPDAAGWPIAWQYTVDGQTTQISPLADGFMPVLQATLFHPLSDQYGLSPIEAAARAVDIHNAGGSWTKALLDNAARPSGALIYKGGDGALSEVQFDRLKRELEEAYSGAVNAGRPLVLEGGLDWRSMSYTPADMDFTALRHAAAREISLAFGIPPMLLGIPGDNTYANYREANLALWRQTILPLVARTAAALSRWIVPLYGTNLRLAYDADAVEALAIERESVWDRLSNATFLTLNERRAAAGYSPLPGGDASPLSFSP